MKNEEENESEENKKFQIETEVQESEEPSKNVSYFEQLLDDVGPDGRFQKLLIWGFIVPLSVCSTLGASNLPLLLTTPPHSCHVGNRPDNVSLELWKNLTIPWETAGLSGRRWSSCFKYNTSLEVLLEGGLLEDHDFEEHHNRSVIECEEGWDFYSSAWKETPVSSFTMVCGRKDHVTKIFSLSFAGNAVGSLLFSVLSDRYGRHRILFLVLFVSIAGSIPSVLAPNVAVFSAFRFFLALAYPSLFQIPYVIAMEICGLKSRNVLVVWAMVGGVVGSCLASAFTLVVHRWKAYLVVCHLPAILFAFYYRVVPESPRWLLSQSRVSECEDILKKVARLNGRSYSERSRRLLLEAQKEERAKKGSFKSFFASFVLVKHLCLTCVLLSLGFCLFSGMLLNIHYMTGSASVNFLILALVGIPGNVVGGFASRCLGRRLSACLFFGVTSLCCFLATFVVEYRWLLTASCALIKMGCGSIILIIFMQVGELFPTSLRASAYGTVMVVSSLSVTLIPPVLALAASNIFLPYYILSILSLAGLLLSTFLPETLGKPLPQTLEEALVIGRNQPYFSCTQKC